MYRRETPWDIVKPLLFFLGSILWLEGIYRAFYVRPFFDVGLVYILLFSLPLAGMCALLTSLWGKKGNRKAGFAVLGVLTPVVHDPVGVPHDLCHRAGHQVLQHGRSGPGQLLEGDPAGHLGGPARPAPAGRPSGGVLLPATVRPPEPPGRPGAAGSDRRRDHRAGRSSAGDRPAHRAGS